MSLLERTQEFMKQLLLFANKACFGAELARGEMSEVHILSVQQLKGHPGLVEQQ